MNRAQISHCMMYIPTSSPLLCLIPNCYHTSDIVTFLSICRLCDAVFYFYVFFGVVSAFWCVFSDALNVFWNVFLPLYIILILFNLNILR